MVVFASLMGALSPFCSCGVIPLIAALLASGVPLAPVMAFWLASPLMDPSMFLITTGVLGLQFAIAKRWLPLELVCSGASVFLSRSGWASWSVSRSRRYRQWWLRRIEDPQPEGRCVALFA